MEKAYRFRLYPNKEQRIQIHRTFGCCRFLHNGFIAARRTAYELPGKSPGYKEQAADIALMKQDPSTAFLKAGRCNHPAK